MGNIDPETLLERAAACSSSIAIADDPDQRALLEHVKDMWKALADEYGRLGEAVNDHVVVISLRALRSPINRRSATFGGRRSRQRLDSLLLKRKHPLPCAI